MKDILPIILLLALTLVPWNGQVQAQPNTVEMKKARTVTFNPKYVPVSNTRIIDATAKKRLPADILVRPDRRIITSDDKKILSVPDKPEEVPVDNPDAYLELEREGPNNIPFDLEKNFGTDVSRVKSDVLSLYGTVLRDGNIKSGYYYYIPKEYNLGWSPINGKYEFNVTYGSTSDGAAGRTTVTAILRPKLRDRDVDIARQLLAADIIGKPEEGFGVKELMAMPMAQPPEIEFTNLTQFGVSTEDISLRAPANLADPILLSFTTAQIDALMAMFFNNIGLFGNVIVYPEGMEGSSVSIPFNLKIDAPETFGQLELTGGGWRTEWRNPTDYPIILGHLHVLRKERNGAFRVYSWKAGETEIPAQAKVDFSTQNIPTWIDTDGRVQRIWMDYTINDCDGCNRSVKQKILGSVAPHEVAKPEKLEFRILTPMAFTEASLMLIKLRSFQASASGDRQESMETVVVNEDGAVLDGGTLYVRDGRVDFDYKIQVYLEDGTTYESSWLKSYSKELVIGSKQIKDNIPEFNN